MISKQKQHQKRAEKRQRARAMPSPSAFAYTVEDGQAMGLPGRTKIYEIDKKLRAEGKRFLFKGPGNRTMIDGDALRELYGIVKTASPTSTQQ